MNMWFMTSDRWAIALGGSGNGDGNVPPTGFFKHFCGGNSLYGTYDLGRTITHEVGHYCC